MRKLVLLFVSLVLFLLYSAYSDCPTVDSNTHKVVEDIKNYFNSGPEESTQQGAADQQSDGLYEDNDSLAVVKERDTAEKSINAQLELDHSTLNNSLMDTEQDAKDNTNDSTENSSGEDTGEMPHKFLDLTLPQLIDEVMDAKVFQYEYKSILPDLFTPVEVERKEPRTSFGGRVLMDETFDEFKVDELRLQDIRGSIEGAELTFEVKTN